MSDTKVFGISQSTVFNDPPLIGDWLVVMESAHVQALRQAEQRGDQRYITGHADGYAQGQRDALAGAVQRVEAAMFDKDGRLHSCGSSIDAGGGIEFCCTCDSQYQAAADIIAAIKGDNNE